MREVCKFTVPGDPAAWSTPEFGTGWTKTGRRYRFAESNDKLKSWQELVALYARQAMAQVQCKEPILGPTGLRLDFTQKPPDGIDIGTPWVPEVKWSPKVHRWVKVGLAHNVPDLTNLFKGTEDALQDIVFGNDGQNCFTWASRLYAAAPGVTVTLYAM